jgi:hypothetical protein
MLKIKKNRLMKEVINSLDNSVHYVSSGVEHLLGRGLEITDDYVVFADPAGYPKKFIDSWKGDFTGLEGNVNDFHVDHNLDMNIFDVKKRISKCIAHGLFQKSIIACEEIFTLFKHCTNIHENDEFVIIFFIHAYDPNVHDLEDIMEWSYWSSSLRFTKERGKNSSWVVDNLEEYSQPAMTINFDKKSIQNISKNWWSEN